MIVREARLVIALASAVACTSDLKAEPTAAAPSPASCTVHVWQSKHFESANGNAVGGLVGALVEDAINTSAPPQLVSEQMARNLEDQDLASLVKAVDWSHYVGAQPVTLTLESTVDDKTMRSMQRSRTPNSTPVSDCQIELFVGKQTFQGGMKTWLFSNFGLQIFKAGQYRGHTGLEYTHVKSFPAKTAEQYPAAIAEIRTGFGRNLTKFLDSAFGG